MVDEPDPNAPATDAESVQTALARAAQDGDEQAFAKLYESLSPALLTWADYRLRTSANLDPADVIQEVWCRAWRRIDTFQADKVPFRAWIFRIAKNVAMEGMRRARQGASEPAGPTTRLFALGNLPDTVTAVSQRMMKMEALKSFRSSIEEQPEEERRLLVHCGLEGLPHKEVAERLGLPIATVTKRWQRLRQRLLEEGIPETLLILS